ncbi:unnamed protein product [Leptidea sinapis]|uniref:Fibrillin n=1 Tax=Leptidea sinapis TaxID=189913 RepID=A0A5E4QL52_9NEOP|nr:unnamed protein product [Leptidea sinapis]
MHQSYCTGGQCRNTAGSFTCVCPPGTRHEPAEQLCRDVDECEEQSNPCDNGRCINTHGSYECECEHGFVLDPTQRHCLDNRRGSCWRRVVDGQCEAAAPGPLLRQECCCSLGLAWGSPCEPCDTEHCPCPKGFAKLDGSTCRDIDECMLDPELCVGGECVNTDGSYRCECPPGLTLDASGGRCVDTRREHCYTQYSGGQCSGPLQVDVYRAVCCCSSLGKAWGGSRCEPCPKKGTDAYRNLCISDAKGPGVWTRPGSGPGDPNRTGIWSQIGGGDDFGNGWDDGEWDNGTDSWGGIGGGMDRGPPLIPSQMEVNECAAFPGLCGHGRCRNMVGTFTCDCFPGYEKDSQNHTCVDVNECEIVEDVCGAGAGECRNTEGSFQCVCRDGYTTEQLSKICVDIDECAENRALCRGGRCVNTPGSFRCECGPGMELAPDRLSCKDVDECSITSGICSNGACENQMGTYQCVCDEGYAQSTVKSHCEDIDECEEDPTRCQHNCVNTPGSYHCTCREGWHLRADGRSCRDIDECAVGTRVCGGGECRNTPGSYRCVCGEGLLASPPDARPACQDVDECQDIPELCGAGECRNTIGSFVCRCPDGYSVKPEQGPACTDDDECELGTCDCHPSADCINLPGSFQCRCRDGWRGDGSECEDIDECLTNNGGCHPRATCRNTDGSFMCLCDTGYKGDGYSCVDIDECANDPTLCENGHCTNTAGGYECDCDVGFTKSQDGRSCLDMDECATFDNVCVFGRCVNTYGMFKCICDKGYQSDSIDDLMPGFNCTDVDECKSPQSCQYGECINTQGSYICRCPPNYELLSDGTACFDSRKARCYGKVDLRSGTEQCRDEDEVSEDGTMAACCCSIGAAWGNYCDLCPEPGSEAYRQLCPGGPGYQPILEPPSYVVTLADIDECAQHPQLCEHGTCTNTFGSFMCTCGAGWRLVDSRCEDEDECAAPDVCGPGVCRNLPGSYVCLCPEGYVAMPNGKECVDVRQRQCYMEWDEYSGTCSGAVGVPQTRYLCCCSVGRAWGAPCTACPDRGSPEHVALCGEKPGEYINPVTNETRPIDECDIMPQLCKPGVCHDTPTGFRCGCDHGSLDECEDVDECSDERLCEHGDCRNTLGSYRCECKAGYTLRDNACRDVDECSRPRAMCRNGTCENLPGSYMCHCDEGFKPGANNDCVDINECREGGMVCRNGRCRNTAGSFRCECAPGYTLAPDGRNCRDVDECSELPAPYRCDCPTGWRFDSASAVCVDERKELCYDEWDVGRCHRARPLQLARAECCCSEGAAWGRYCERCPTPDSPEFLRICQGGMGRPNLTQDLDECMVRPDVCKGGRCINTDGSFRCACPAGYTLDASGLVCVDADECVAEPRICGNGTDTMDCQTCVDIDECAEGRAQCSFRCHNTAGSFRCTCPFGFTLAADGIHCRDVDECADDADACPHACENIVGSYVCKCPEGYKRTSAPHDAADACEDIDECAEGAEDPPTYYRPQNWHVSPFAGVWTLCARALAQLARLHAYTAHAGHQSTMLLHLGRGMGSGVRAVSSARHSGAGGPLLSHQPDHQSFRCVCSPGYKSMGGTCADIDECASVRSPCEQLCTNTEGSYECLCRAGYEPRFMYDKSSDSEISDKSDINECHEEGICPSGGKCVNLLGSYRCVCPRGYRLDVTGTRCLDRDECEDGRCSVRSASGGCVPQDVCAAGPCGDAPCFPLGAAYRCGCPAGYGWHAAHAVCLQMAGGCATASCLFGCTPFGDSYQCGCPAGYQLVGAGHCLTALDPSLPAGDIGDAPVFPVKDQYKIGGDNELISTEGCFSCKMNGRHRRAPEEGIVFANGTTLVRRRRRRSRRRRSLLEPEAELIVVKATPRQTWGRVPLMRLVAAEGQGRPHYRIAYGDPQKRFILNKKDGTWALRLRKHLKSTDVMETQLEVEARFVTTQTRRRRQAELVPAPLRLYVSVRIGPDTTNSPNTL